MFIRSERLFLRPGWPEDWRDIMAQVADEAIVRNLVEVPWPYTADDARAFAARAQDARHPHFLVTLPGADGAAVIGCIGLKPGDGQSELGYWIGRAHWGRGYATEAARAVMRLARTLGHRRLSACHFSDNPASGRVLAKLGFSATGIERRTFNPVRGHSAPGAVMEIDLGAPCDCDGMDDPANARRAA